jgi:hypothetical protein
MLTPEEAANAIYIDFEGGQDLPPTFVGVFSCAFPEHRWFEQIVFEDCFRSAVQARSSGKHRWPRDFVTGSNRPLEVRSVRRFARLQDWADDIVRLAARTGSPIVSWSSREYRVLRAACSPESLSTLDDVSRDALDTARLWKRLFHRPVLFERIPGRARHRLTNYMELIGYRLPRYFGDRQAAQRIDHVRQQLLRHGCEYETLTPVAKAKWTKVLDYNWHDCNGMREVLMRASLEIAGTQGRNTQQPTSAGSTMHCSTQLRRAVESSLELVPPGR